MDFAFRNIKIKYVIPVFLGMIFSLLLSAVILSSLGFNKKAEPAAVEIKIKPEIEEEEPEDFSLLFAVNEIIPDPVLEYYRNQIYKEWVIGFFTEVCSNEEIAKAILESSDISNVSPALAFALCWEESKFNENAENSTNLNGSVDRGLFQLNSYSFPYLDSSIFFDIKSNARLGIGYLRHCLNTGGSEVSALAMYNAGAGRVSSTGAPHVTLNYISRILDNRQKIESRFHSRLIKEEEERLSPVIDINN